MWRPTRVPTTAVTTSAPATTDSSRSVSQKPRSRRSRVLGRYVSSASASTSDRRSSTGGEPIQLVPFFALPGAAESTATSAFFGTRRPAAAIPELPRKARLPTFARPIRIQPLRSS